MWEPRRALQGVSHLSVDEKAIHRGYELAMVVSDFDRGVFLVVSLERDKASVYALPRGLLRDLKNDVQAITTDNWKAYISCVAELFPNATLFMVTFI